MRRFLTLAVAFMFIGCESTEPDSGPIESEIFIEAREMLGPGSRRLTLSCSTRKIYPCINFPILTEQSIDENSFKVTFTSVGETTLCLTALGPATTSIDLHALPNGEYPLELNNAARTNKGTLRVTGSEIGLLFEHEDGIEIVRRYTKRVPVNTYWGVIGYHVQSSSSLVEEFVEKLEAQGALFNKQDPGHYFYYEIDGTGDMVVDTQMLGYYFARPVIFQYHGDESQLKELIEGEGGKYKDALSISLNTYQGEQINNWSN